MASKTPKPGRRGPYRQEKSINEENEDVVFDPRLNAETFSLNDDECLEPECDTFDDCEMSSENCSEINNSPNHHDSGLSVRGADSDENIYVDGECTLTVSYFHIF